MSKPCLFPYFGGKDRLAAKLIPLFPQHRCYVEVFGGAGNVLIQKPPSKTVANLKAASGPTTLKSVASLAATFQTYTDVVITDTDLLAFSIKCTLSSNTVYDGGILIGSMITTTAGWLPIKGGESGSRLEIKKNASNQLQMRRQGPISNVNVVVLKLN